MSDVVTRFAPSPTGRLHVGNIRTALLNWLLARQHGGRFLLRMDDTDAARSTQAFAQSIRDDLAWLGMAPDGEVRQSDRIAAYDAALERLAASGHAYRCYETPQELDIKRKTLLARGLPPIYDRAALALTDADHARFAEQGAAPHWRFKLSPQAPHAWHDLIRGDSRITPESLSDPVIRRADGGWLYMLPSVIDDIDMGVTHVVRGEDHVTNTGIQLQMFAALDAPAPAFGHAALLTGADGALSKRLGSLGVDALRERGIEPAAIKALLARLGTSLPVEPTLDDDALVAGFDIGNLGRATARFDEAELEHLNARIIHAMPFDAVAARLPEGLTAEEWIAIRPNLSTVADAAAWHSIVQGPVDPPVLDPDDRAYAATAADALAALAPDHWGPGAWAQLTAALKETTGRKGKALFLPLRLALTGLAAGPDMAALLPLLPQERAVARLRAAA